MTIAELERAGQPIPDPMWPIVDKQAWIMECIRMEAFLEENERHRTQCLREKAINDKLDAERKKLKKGRYQRRHKPSIIIMGILSQGGINMKKTKTKTGLIDQLLREDLAAAYAEGGVVNIVSKVLAQFPNESEKSLKGLVFSRRAVLKNALAQKSAAEAAA